MKDNILDPSSLKPLSVTEFRFLLLDVAAIVGVFGLLDTGVLKIWTLNPCVFGLDVYWATSYGGSLVIGDGVSILPK